MPRRDAREQILDGVLLALARHGLERVSMTDVAREAGVSRGTLYRYFPSQDALLRALGEKVRTDFRVALEKAIAEKPELPMRAELVISTLRTFNSERPALAQLTNAEPGFALEWFRTNRRALEEPIRDALAPLTGQRNARQRKDLVELTDLVYRVAISYNLVPPETGEADAAWFAAMVHAYLETGGTQWPTTRSR